MSWARGRRFARIGISAFAGLCSVLVAPTFPTSTSLASAFTPTVLYVSNGVEVISTYNVINGCSRVYLTSDFTNWRYVTPPLKAQSGACH